MNDNAIKDAALAGALNAAALVGVMQGSYKMGLDETPIPTQFATKVLGLDEKAATPAGGALLIVAGAAWGALYAATVKKRSAKSGLLFSILPTLVVYLVNYPLIGKGLFAGGKLKALLLPAGMNAAWGAYVGSRSANS